MEQPKGGHVGRKFFDAIQKNQFESAADYLTCMALRHLESPQAGAATLQVFLSAHLVSAFDLAGTLPVEQLGSFEETIQEALSPLAPAQYREEEALSQAIRGMLSQIALACGLSQGRGAGKMEEVRLRIEARYWDPNLSVSALAEEFSCSLSYLSRAFKQSVGLRPNEYLHATRIRHARMLLRTTCQPISQIAYQVGFSSPSAFIRSYRTAEGVTPGADRARMQRVAEQL